MLGSIRDITSVIVVALLMFVVMLVFFIVTLDSAELTSDSFTIGNQQFISCAADYTKTSNEYKQYADQQVLTMDVESLADMRISIEAETTCNSDFVKSNNEQLHTYANDVYNYVSTKYPDANFGLLDTVYTAPAKYYAYLGLPQDYLFFTMDESQSILLAYIYSPTTDDGQISELWSIDEANDLELVQNYTNNLLVKYYEKVI